MLTEVYLLWRSYEREDVTEKSRLCGVYSSHEKAEAARQRLLDKPGFKDRPDDFVVGRYGLDHDEWTEGYISWDEA